MDLEDEQHLGEGGDFSFGYSALDMPLRHPSQLAVGTIGSEIRIEACSGEVIHKYILGA